MSDVQVSVIIVNFNAGELLTACVQSVLLSRGVNVEVIVSDNGSSDGSVHYLRQMVDDPRLRIECQGENLGFAKANNRVVGVTSGEYLLFLNPDCLVKPATLSAMIQEMESHPDAGMGGCLILNLNGSEQAGCRRRIPTPRRSLMHMSYLDRFLPQHTAFESVAMHYLPLPEHPVYNEALSGAFMFVRRRAMNDVGLMDEGYFLHCEDLDWCMRFSEHGWKILFLPHITITHAKGACSTPRPIRVEWHKHKGMVRFYRKFFRREYSVFTMLLVIAAVWVRFFFVFILGLFKNLVR